MSEPKPEDRPLVDEAALRAYLETHLPLEPDERATEGATTLRLVRHQAGHSNETFFVTWGTREMVLRRPPAGAFLPTAHDVLREHRILTRLQPADVPTPDTYLACEDEDVIGAPFYLMEKIEGQVLRDHLPPGFEEAEAHPKIAHGLVDALAKLHNIDWEAVEMDDIGKPKGYLERQVARWQDQWDRTRPHTEEVREIPALDQVGAWLDEQVPETEQTTIVHGDYKLDNVVFDSDPVRLTGILDWEMATLGDPLADLGWMLSFWREKGDPVEDILPIEPRLTEQESFPSRQALADRWAEQTGLTVHDLPWYVTLATWKLAVLLEGSYARHLAGATDDPFFDHMETAVPALAERALQFARGRREV